MGVNAVEALNQAGACADSIRWVLGQKDKRPGALWGACPRPEWLVWWLRKFDGFWGPDMDVLTRILVEHEIAYPSAASPLDPRHLEEVWLDAVEHQASSWLVLTHFSHTDRPRRSRLLLDRIRREFPEPPGASS